MKLDRYWLMRMDNKYGKYSIRNLMSIIVFGMALVYIADMVLISSKGISLSQYFMFDREALFGGQVWRFVSFAFLPPDWNLLLIALTLYFYWFIGAALENAWGSFKFNIYYACGMFGTIAAGLVTGSATNYYLNMSLFLAFAVLFPELEVRLFFVLPVKVKYMALLDAVYLLFILFISSWTIRAAIIAAFLNLGLFFWRDLIAAVKRFINKNKVKRMSRKTRDEWRRNSREVGGK